MIGFWAVLRKEFAHLRRQRSTIFFALIIPAMQLTIFGFAANTTIDNIPLALLDLDRREESRQLIEAFENTRTFRVAAATVNLDTFAAAIRSGRAKTGLIIPPDFSARLLHGEVARLQVQVDGSDAQVAASALQTSEVLIRQLAQRRSVGGNAIDDAGRPAPAMESRQRVLFNPDLADSHFFVPGLVAIILQSLLSFLTAFSIARERELGTLEQLFVTPVSAGGLLLGKITPYALLSVLELFFILFLMRFLFGVPIAGNLVLLVLIAGLFILTALGLGLMISTIATSQLQAMQFTFLIMLPSVLLSGFVFPRSEMPLPLYLLSSILPATYFVEIVRGIIVRGADFFDVLPNVLGLAACTAIIAAISLLRFHKTLD